MSEGKKEILLGDCLELMKQLPNQSVDMILCDLPYGTTACKWDAIIPFDKLWEQYERIIKPNGAIVLTASQPFTSALVMSKPKWFRHEWVWQKNRGSNFALLKWQPFKEHESVLVFSKETANYFPIKEQRSEGGKARVGNGCVMRKSNTGKRETMNNFVETEDRYCEELRFPSSIQKFNTEVGLHPTQKPVTLFEYLVKTYSKENDLVLDNCAGSGTTAIACLNTKRQFIVMEQDPNYFEKIKKRVGEFNKNFEPQTLFGNEM